MPELTPDPVFDKLGRFSPDVGLLDPAAILFQAGKASARTPPGWKLAVAGLVLTNLATVALFLFRPREVPPAPEAVVVPVVVPVPVPEVVSPVPESPAVLLSPWSYGALIGTADIDQLPRSMPVTGRSPQRPPLAAGDGRRGDLD